MRIYPPPAPLPAFFSSLLLFPPWMAASVAAVASHFFVPEMWHTCHVKPIPCTLNFSTSWKNRAACWHYGSSLPSTFVIKYWFIHQGFLRSISNGRHFRPAYQSSNVVLIITAVLFIHNSSMLAYKANERAGTAADATTKLVPLYSFFLFVSVLKTGQSTRRRRAPIPPSTNSSSIRSCRLHDDW